MRSIQLTLLYTLSGFLLVLVATLVSVQYSPLSPKHASNLVLAEYYFSDGKTGVTGAYDRSKARQYYQAALSEQSEYPEYIEYQIGRLDFLEANFDAAVARFENMLTTYGDSLPQVYYMLGLTYGYRAQWYENETDWQSAEENFITFMERSPAAPWPRVDLAWVYFSQGKFQEMLPIVKEGLTYNPDNAWLLNMYGLALLNTGEAAAAETQFRRALEAIHAVSLGEWGRVYPGNQPSSWSQGLEETKQLIEQNLKLSQERV